jgi:aminopeptidase C
LPKSGFVTRNEFVGYFKDGVLLARLANKFQPGAAEAVKEGEDAKSKENQQANMNVFASVAKEHVPEEHQFTHDDLQKGKESFPKLFVNLVQLMIKAPAEHFKQAGGNFDQLITEISSIQDQKFFQKFINGINNIGQHISTFVKKPVS